MNRTAGDPSLALEARELTVVLGGKKIVDVPEFHVRANEVMMIIGPNGSGKSTMLLSLALLLKKQSGTIYYRGVPVHTSSEILAQRRRLAAVLQEPLLLNSSVMENVTLGMRLRGFEHHTLRQRAEKWLERFGVAPLARRQARTLSGGEARRVSLARAFVLEPEVMFLDEPFIALDSPTRQGLLEDFESVVRETKNTIVMVTHDRNEALVLGDRVAVIMGGSIRQCGTPQEIFSSPVDEQVATFVEAGNILRGTVTDQQKGIATVDVEGVPVYMASDLPRGTDITAYMHYEDVTVYASVENVVSSARNRLEGKVVRSFITGSQMKVFIDCGFILTALITRRSWDELGLEVGKRVMTSFKASALHPVPRLSEANQGCEPGDSGD